MNKLSVETKLFGLGRSQFGMKEFIYFCISAHSECTEQGRTEAVRSVYEGNGFTYWSIHSLMVEDGKFYPMVSFNALK